MRITALVENRSDCELKPKHGLSLYIETEKHRLLFDVGPDHTLFDNADKRGIDLAEVDAVIISHGHIDHGGALERFLRINHTAKVYVQRKAFEKYYLKVLFLKVGVGLPSALRTNPQIVLADGDHMIDEELLLFTVPDVSKCRSNMNDVLYSEQGRDDFSHEQNLMIMGNTRALIMGCGHAGVVNIVEKAARYQPEVCVGGYHLMNPVTRETVSDDLLEGIAREMGKHDIRYYTCHCTGQKPYDYLSKRVPDMRYLSCGEMVELCTLAAKR